MSLQATGLISGFDVNSIIDDLIKAESKPRQRLEEREKILAAQQEQLKTINSNLLILQSRAASLADRTSTLQKIATSSDISVLEATASTSAPRQTHQIEVSQLATSSRNSSTLNISKPIELNRLAKLTLESSTTTGAIHLDNYSSTNTLSLSASTTLDNIATGLTFTPTDDTYQDLSYKTTYRGAGNDARMSVTKRVSKLDSDTSGVAVLNDKTKSLVANKISFVDTDTNTTSTLGLSTSKQTVFGTGDAYDANSKQLNLDASNRTHQLGEIRVVEAQNSGSSTVSSGLSSSATATSFDVANGSLFSVGDTIAINNEQMKITAISSNTLTVTRGINGTTAVTHSNGANVYGDIVRVSTEDIGNITVGDVLTFSGGGLGTSAKTGTVQGIVNLETGTFAVSGDIASYNLESSTVTANSGAGSAGNQFTTKALTPGSFTVNNSTYYVPKVLDSSLAVKQSNTTNIASTQTVAQVGSSITTGTFTVNENTITISGTSNTISSILSNISAISGITGSLTDGGRLQIKADAGVPISIQDGTSNFASQLNFSQGISSGKSVAEFGVNAGTFSISDTATSTSQAFEITSSSAVATTLSASVSTTSATSVSVANSSGLSVGDTIAIGNEQMTISAISGTTLTVSRGVNSTVAATHSSGATVSNIATTETVLDILKKINQSNFGVTASLQPSGDIRLTNSDGTKTGLSVSDGTSNFASVFGFVESGVALQDIFDNVNATSTASVGIQDVVKGSNEVYLDQTLTDDHALWVNGRSFVMSTSSNNGYTSIGGLIDAINQYSDSTNVKASLTRLKNSGAALNDSSSTSAKGYFQLVATDGNSIEAFLADTADVSGFTQTTNSNDTVTFASATSVTKIGEKVTFTGGALGAEQIELEVQEFTSSTNFKVKTDKDLTNAVLVRVTDESGIDLFPPTENTSLDLTSLGAAISSTTATSITISSASTYVKVHDVISIGTEQMLVTGISGSTVTVTRGYNNSTAATHSNAASIGLAFGYDIGKTSETLGTLDKKKSKKQLFLEQKEANLTLGGSSDTSDFFSVVGLNDLLVVAESHKLGFAGNDSNLYNPTAQVRSSIDNLSTSILLSDISSEIEAGTFNIDGTSVAVGAPTTTQLSTLITNISAVANVTASLVDGQLQITTTANTMTISDDLATSPGDDPDISTKLLKHLGIPTGTYTKGNFAGLTTNPTLGQASINGTLLDVTLNTTINDLVAKINSTDFTNMQAEYDSTTDQFRLQSEMSTASRISLGATEDTSNILMALKLSETTQRSEIAGTQAKLVSFTDPLTSSIQNGDTFYLNNQQVTILDLNTTGIDVDDIVAAVNEVTTQTGVTAYSKDPDSSSATTDGKLYLKRTNGTRIELQSGNLDVYSELRVKNSDLQVQDSSNNVVSTPRSVIDSSGRLGGVDIYAKLSEGRFRNGALPSSGSFNINSVTINYEGTDSLQDVLDRINSSDAGVTASYNVLEDKIDMVSNSTGSPLIRLESNQVNQVTFTNVDVDSTTDQIFFHRPKDTSIQDSENERDYAFIADGNQLSFYDTLTNTVASNTTGETTSVNEVTLQSTVKSVAVKDALLPDTQNFRSATDNNYTLNVDHENKYAVKQYSSAYNAVPSNVALSITVTDNSTLVGTYTVTHSESGGGGGTINLTRDRDSGSSNGAFTYSSSGTQNADISFANGGTIRLSFNAANLDSAGSSVLNNTKIRIEALNKDDAAVDSSGNIYAVNQVYDGSDVPDVTFTSNATVGESSKFHMDDGMLRMPASNRDFDLSSSTISMDLTATPASNSSSGTITYAAPTSGTRSNMLFTLTGNAGDFAGYKQYNTITIMDDSNNKRFEGVIETSGNLTSATEIKVRPVANFEEAPNASGNRTLPYLDNVYFDGSTTMLPGRRAVGGAFSAHDTAVFLDLTRPNDYDLSNSGSQNGIQINNGASNIGAVMELSTSGNNEIPNLAGGNGNLIIQSTSGFDADITVSSANWSASSNTVTITQGADYNWGAGNVSIKGLSSLTASGTVTNEEGGAAGADNISGGSGYTTASGVAVTGGSGSGMTVNITASGGGAVTGVTINNAGTGYQDNEVITINVGGADATFRVNGITNATAADVSFSNAFFRNVSSDTLTATINGSSKTLTLGSASNGFTVTDSQNISLVGVTGGISSVTLNAVSYAGTGSHSSAGIGLNTTGTDSYLTVALNDSSSTGDILQFKQNDILTIKNQTAFSGGANGQAKIRGTSGTTLQLTDYDGAGFANVDFPDANSTHITGLKRTTDSSVSTVTPDGSNIYTFNLTDADNKYKEGDLIVFRQLLDDGSPALEERLLEVTKSVAGSNQVLVKVADNSSTNTTLSNYNRGSASNSTRVNNSALSSKDVEPNVGLRSLRANASTANGKIVAPEQGIAISGTKMFVADGTHQLRAYTIDPTNSTAAATADSTLTVDLGTARFKNLFGAYDDGTNYNVYGLGKTGWAMGDVSGYDAVDRTVLVAQINKSNGNVTVANAVDLTGQSLNGSGDEVRRITDGQVIKLSTAGSAPDGSRLAEAGRAYVFLSYEPDSWTGASEKALMKAYRLDNNATDPDSNTAIDFVFTAQNGSNLSTIDSFAIEELAGGEITATINQSGDTMNFDLTQTSADGTSASDTASVTDNRPAKFDSGSTNTIAFRDNELDEENSNYDGYARIFSGNGSTFIAGTTASTGSNAAKATTTYREQKGAGFMDVAFVADSQDSLLKIVDVSKKGSPTPQKSVKVTYGGNTVGTVQDLSVDHPYNYYSGSSKDQDKAYLYAISDDGTNGGLFRLDASDPLANGVGTVTTTSGSNFRLLAANGLNKDGGTAETLTHVFASQGNVFVAGRTGGSGNSKVAFFTNHTLLNEALDNSETAIDVDDGSVFQAGDTIVIGDEQMTVGSISTNTLNVTRGANSTTASAHDDDSPVMIASAVGSSHLSYPKVNGTATSGKYELAGSITDVFFDDSNHSNLASGRYLYVGVDSTKVYRYDMQTTLGEVVEYDLSGLGITKVQNITVSHPTSSQTILYVTDSQDNERVSAFDISTGTPTPVSMTTVNSADEVFVGRDINGDQIVHFIDDSTMYTMSDLTATNSFMSALNMSEDSGTAGKDLIGSLNGVEFQRNTNENRDLLSGVTLNFKGTTSVGSPISVTVEPDSDSVVESVKSFVDQYNQTETALRQAVNAQRIFNPRTEEELTQGVLANDTMLRSLMMRLSSISSLPVVGTGAVKRLGDLGINRGRAGSVSIDQIKSGLELKLDEGKLRSAISANPEGAASVFGSISSLGTKAHRPVPKDTETTVTVSSANYSLLETKIGKQVLIKNSTTGAIVPMTLSGVNSSGKQLNLTSGTFSTADYSGYQLELLVDNAQPWHAISINSTTPNSTNKETVLKISDGGTINTQKDQQNLNRVANKLNSTVDLQLKTTLGSNISNNATSITLSDASKFSDSGTIVVSQINSGSLQYEVMKYTSKSGNTLSGLTRGVDVNTTYTTSPLAFTTANSAKVAQTLFTVNVTDVDMDENFVTVGSYLDTDVVSPSNSTIVSVDGTIADITMTSIEQSAANRSLMKVAPGLIKDFSIGSRLRLKQGSKTNDFNILSLDTNRISGFNSKTMPPAGGSNGNVTKATNTSGKITTTSGSSGTTVMTVWADDLRSFIGRSRVLLSNGTQDEEATINTVDSSTRLLSDYTNSTLFVTGGSASQAGITAASSVFNSGLNLGTGSDKGKFEVHVGDAVYDVDLFGGSYTVGSTISLSTLASRIDSVSGVSASVTGSNYIRVEADSSVAGVNSDTPVVITGKYTSASNYGINLFSPTNRNEDLIKFSGIAEVTLNTPANVPNLTGFNTIKAAYNDTMLVQGSLPTLTTGDLLVEGVAESTENTLAAYTRLSTGIIGKRLQNIVSQAKRVYEDMDTFDDKIREKELKLLREYGSLEAALGETQVQSQYLTAQLANLQSTAQSISKRKK